MHSHILWEIDDGSKSLNMSAEMLKIAVDNGTTDIVATPHVIEKSTMPGWQEIMKKTERLKKIADEHDLNINIYPGAEVQMNWELLDELTEAGDFCINNTCYMLVELPMLEIPAYASEFWYELQLRGIIPILAHPERYRLLHNKPEILLEWRRQEVLFQCNSGSFIGLFGSDAANSAKTLLKNNLVDCIGSDAHRSKARNTNMQSALNYINEYAGSDQSALIFKANPEKILTNKHIDFLKPKQMEKLESPKGFLQRLLGR